ncbi:MAG TPA: hypothetical protein VG961_05855, partial [Ignavibacteria bacterium]|nr:hypothetical protein [Ignavibacteria bacterium]
FQAFDINLFMKLKPPLIGLKVKRFDGCAKGDIVQVEISLFGFKQNWTSLITEQVQNEKEIYFVDEGTLLPKPLKYWKHKHIIENSVDSSIIIDDITYRSGSIVVDFLLFPAFFLQFFYRKPVYRSYFSK